MPTSKLRFVSSKLAYVWAIEVTYDKASYDDEFQGFTVKNTINDLTAQQLDRCISDEVTGLEKYFKHGGEFEGFDINTNIATDGDSHKKFEVSVNKAFENYNKKFGLRGDACSEQVKGIGLITSTALSIDGFLLRQVFDYIKQ